MIKKTSSKAQGAKSLDRATPTTSLLLLSSNLVMISICPPVGGEGGGWVR